MDTLRSHGDSYFANFRADFMQEEEIFIDRPSKHFQQILDYFRCREFVACEYENLKELAEIRRELEYYQLAELLGCVQERAKEVIFEEAKACKSLGELSKLEKRVEAYKFSNKDTLTIIEKSREKLKSVVVYNIGGTIFKMKMERWKKIYTGTLLTPPESDNPPPVNLFIFDRDPKHFRMILNYLNHLGGAELGDITMRSLLERSLHELEEITAELEYYEFEDVMYDAKDAIFWKKAPESIEFSGRSDNKPNAGVVNGVFKKNPHKCGIYERCAKTGTKNFHFLLQTHNKEWLITDKPPGGVYAKTKPPGSNDDKFSQPDKFIWNVFEGEDKKMVQDKEILTTFNYFPEKHINVYGLEESLDNIRKSLDDIWPTNRYGSKQTNFGER